jgi:hypothetical protein
VGVVRGNFCDRALHDEDGGLPDVTVVNHHGPAPRRIREGPAWRQDGACSRRRRNPIAPPPARRTESMASSRVAFPIQRKSPAGRDGAFPHRPKKSAGRTRQCGRTHCSADRARNTPRSHSVPVTLKKAPPVRAGALVPERGTLNLSVRSVDSCLRVKHGQALPPAPAVCRRILVPACGQRALFGIPTSPVLDLSVFAIASRSRTTDDAFPKETGRQPAR